MNCVVIHNQSAGDETHDKDTLTKALEEEGYDCRYFSTKGKGWRDFPVGGDLLIVAGGDGTVRKATRELLKRKLKDQPDCLTIIPLGTANNISRSLKIKGELSTIIRSWAKAEVKSFDLARVLGLEKPTFILEGFGFGVFPELMRAMDKLPDPDESAEESLLKAWKILYNIILGYRPRSCKIEIDGKDYSGNYIMVEVLNTPLFGPNLHLSPGSDPGDGLLEIILVTEKDRSNLAAYVKNKNRKTKEKPVSLKVVQGKNIKICWDGSLAHSDDQLIKIEKSTPIRVRVKQWQLNLLVP